MYSRRIPELDGLRGVAIALVLYYHYFQARLTAPHGTVSYFLFAIGRLSWSGVDLFFVLSGFLIGGILIDNQGSPHYFSTFYIRRACRIFPIYLIDCLLFLLGSELLSGRRASPFWPYWYPTLPRFSYLVYVQNLYMAHRGTWGGTGMAPTWSLAVEEQFYLVVPTLLLVFRRHIEYVLGAIILSVPILRVALYFRLPHGGFADYVLMPCRADALLLGVLCAVLVRRPWFWSLLAERRRAFCWAAAVLGLGLSWLGLENSLPEFSLKMASVGYTWLALFYSTILLLSISNQDALLAKGLRRKTLGWLGSISYGVYLFHFWILAGSVALLRGNTYAIHDFRDLAAVVFALSLTLAVCTLSWRFFEKPLVRLGHRASY